MDTVYLNWAATSPHLPEGTKEAVTAYLNGNHQSANRALPGVDEAEMIFEAREVIADFFGVGQPEQVIFTYNATMAMNMVLNGLLEHRDHVLTTNLEHNAVLRPLYLLQQKEVTASFVETAFSAEKMLADLDEKWQPNTRALVMTHASNVSGLLLPVKECFAWAHQKGLMTILDASQTAGLLPLDMAKLNCDVLIFAGHKGLRGLPGIGGFCLTKEAVKQIRPWLVGGTGNASSLLEQPDFLPDKYEAGTPNMLGILSLKTSIQEIKRHGLDNIATHEKKLVRQFLSGIQDLPVKLLGPQSAAERVPVISIQTAEYSSGELAWRLYEDYGIISRYGLHCAPLAHKTLGSYPDGAVRFSFGEDTTEAEISYTLKALNNVLKGEK